MKTQLLELLGHLITKAASDGKEEVRLALLELRERVHGMEDEAERDANRLKALREMMGYLDIASETVVKLFQDDATRSYFVKVGKSEYFGESLGQAIDDAAKSEL